MKPPKTRRRPKKLYAVTNRAIPSLSEATLNEMAAVLLRALKRGEVHVNIAGAPVHPPQMSQPRSEVNQHMAQQIALSSVEEAAAMALLSHPVSKQGEQYVTSPNAAADLATYRRKREELASK